MMSDAATCAAARSAMAAGELARARVLLDDALRSDGGGGDRLELLSLRARLAVLLGEGPDLVEPLEAAAAAAEPSNAEAAGRLLLEVVVLKLYVGHTDAVTCAHRARSLVSEADAFTQARADTLIGLACAFAGDAPGAQAHLERGADLVRVGGAPDEVAYLLQHVVVGLASVERYATALTVCRRYVRAVRAVGADGLLPVLLCYLANSAYFTADFDEMEMAATEAADVAGATGQAAMAAYALACRGVVLGLRGDGEAVAVLERGREQLGAAGAGTIRMLPSLGLALAAMGAGDWRGAVTRFAELRVLVAEARPVPGLLHWRADEVEALWRAGETASARARLVELAADAAPGPWERAAAARVAGLLAESPEEAEGHFMAALEHHADCSSVFERARTELCFGEWLAGQGRRAEASDRLEAAGAIFDALDLRPWAGRARTVLESASAEPDAVDDAVGTEPEGFAAGSGPVEVRAFGPLTVVRDGVEVRVGLDRRGRVLRRLAAAGGSLHAEQLIEALWPEATRENGSARLRTVLARVRRGYGPLVQRDGAVLRWADGVAVDVDRFEALARQALGSRRGPEAVTAAQEAVHLYRGDLLPLERDDADVVAARDRARRRYLALLDLLVDDDLEHGRNASAMAHLRTAIDADPVDETRHVRLARLLAEEGQHARARAVVETALENVRELDLPMPVELARLQRELGVRASGS